VSLAAEGRPTTRSLARSPVRAASMPGAILPENEIAFGVPVIEVSDRHGIREPSNRVVEPPGNFPTRGTTQHRQTPSGRSYADIQEHLCKPEPFFITLDESLSRLSLGPRPGRLRPAPPLGSRNLDWRPAIDVFGTPARFQVSKHPDGFCYLSLTNLVHGKGPCPLVSSLDLNFAVSGPRAKISISGMTPTGTIVLHVDRAGRLDWWSWSYWCYLGARIGAPGLVIGAPCDNENGRRQLPIQHSWDKVPDWVVSGGTTFMDPMQPPHFQDPRDATGRRQGSLEYASLNESIVQACCEYELAAAQDQAIDIQTEALLRSARLGVERFEQVFWMDPGKVLVMSGNCASHPLLKQSPTSLLPGCKYGLFFAAGDRPRVGPDRSCRCRREPARSVEPDGFVFCRACQTLCAVGESGPDESAGTICSCGAFLFSPGDHVWSPGAVVVVQGVGWTGAYPGQGPDLITYQEAEVIRGALRHFGLPVELELEQIEDSVPWQDDICWADSAWTVVYLPISFGYERFLTHCRFTPAFHGSPRFQYVVTNLCAPKGGALRLCELYDFYRSPFISAPDVFCPAYGGASILRGGAYHSEVKFWQAVMAVGAKVYGIDELFFLNRNPLLVITDEDLFEKGGLFFPSTEVPPFMFTRLEWGNPSLTVHQHPGGPAAGVIDNLSIGVVKASAASPSGWRGHPWSRYSEAKSRARIDADRSGIKQEFQFDQRVLRHGPRYAHGQIELPHFGDRVSPVMLDGAGWRPEESVYGLRNTRCWGRSHQAMSPELLNVCNLDIKRRWGSAHDTLLDQLLKLQTWAAGLPNQTLVASLGIRSTSDMAAVIHHWGHLYDRFIVFTEAEIPEEHWHERIYYVRVPLVLGHGYAIQLMRCVWLHLDVAGNEVLGCIINDPVPDPCVPHVNRMDLYEVLEYYDVASLAAVFHGTNPAPGLAGYFGSRRVDLAKFVALALDVGWVYSFDEWWHLYLKIPNFMTSRFTLGTVPTYPHIAEEIPFEICSLEHGRRVVGTYRYPFSSHERPKHARNAKVIRTMFDHLPNEAELEEYEGPLRSACNRFTLQNDLLTIFTWGTRGDRLPVAFMAKELRRMGCNVLVVHITAPAQGLEDLRLCEDRKAWRLLPRLAQARAVMAKTSGRIMHPYYFWRLPGALTYSLAPPSSDSTAPCGGLPRWVDWAVPYMLRLFEIDVHIAFANGISYFERSHDGKTPLTLQDNNGKGRQVVVTGSSSIPIPPEFTGWDVLPGGDHLIQLREVTRVACAGGAGLVATCRAAGVNQVITWSNDIDRQWLNPRNAGHRPTTQPTRDTFVALALQVQPNLTAVKLALGTPALWPRIVYWGLKWSGLVLNVWRICFLAWSFRYRLNLMPTIDGTLLWTLGLQSAKRSPLLNLVGLVAGYATITIMKAFLGVGTLGLIMHLAKRAYTAGTSPFFIAFLTLGLSTSTSLVICLVLERVAYSNWLQITNAFHTGSLRKGQQDGVWLGMQPVIHGGVVVGLHSMYYDATNGLVAQGTFGKDEQVGSAFCYTQTSRPTSPKGFWIQTDLEPGDIIWHGVPVGAYGPLWNCQVQTMAVALGARGSAGLIAVVALFFGTGWAIIGLAVTWITIFFAQASVSTALFAVTPLKLWGIDFGGPLRRLREQMPGWIPLFAVAGDYDEESLSNLKEALSILCAQAIDDGIPARDAFHAAGETLLQATGASQGTTFARGRPEIVTAQAMSSDERKDQYHHILHMARKAKVPEPLIEALARTYSAIVNSTCGILLFFGTWIGFTLDLLTSMLGRFGMRAVVLLIEETIEQVNPGGTRRKNCWAPGYRDLAERMTFVDWLSLSLNTEMTTINPKDPIAWTAERLNAFRPAGEEPLDPEHIYQRGIFLPPKPRVTHYELEYPSLLQSFAATIDPTLEARAQLYEKMGATPGLDGSWFAQPGGSEDELRARYSAEGKPYSAEEEALLEQAVEAIYTKYPEAFDKPGLVTPETVRKHVMQKHKYSSGLPFMQRYKTRSAMEKAGWMESIVQATYKHLEEGTFPPHLYHCFLKGQVVTKPRMVTAEALLSSFVAQVSQLELMKRPLWAMTDFGMGMPLNARYLGQAFERVNGRKVKFGADARQFDSFNPPLIYEGLARLQEKGARKGGNPTGPKIQRARYYQMQNATLVDLLTGHTVGKRRGGGTGQSATSWDNHWSWKIMAVMIWSFATGREPSTFWETNTTHNTSDDNIWGTDDNLDPQALTDAAMQLFGIEFKVETRGGITDLVYLGRIPLRSSEHLEDARIAGLEYQEFVAGPHRQQLLLRRSAVLARYSGAPYHKYMTACLQRTIGHLQLCAFDRELYSLLIREYMEDAANFVGVPEAILWTCTYDENGHCMSAEPKLRRHHRLSERAMARFRIIQKKTMRAPPYKKVLEISGRPSPQQHAMSKFKQSVIQPTLENNVRAWLLQARSTLHTYLPTHLVRLQSASDSLPVSPLLWVPGWPVEKFVMREMIEERDPGESLPSLSEFSDRLRQSPLVPATDTVGFYWWLEIPGSVDVLLAQDRHALRGRMMACFILYHVIMTALIFLRRMPVIGLLVEGYLTYTVDVPRIYGLASTLHWVSHGEASPTITSLMHKDPYTGPKIMCVIAGALTPTTICKALSILVPPSVTAAFGNAIATWRLLFQLNDLDPAGQDLRPNPWLELIDDLLATFRANRFKMMVESDTATGKTTMLVAALIARGYNVWLLTPRRYLRDTYSNPWVVQEDIQIFRSGSTDERTRLKVMTFGHFMTRLARGIGPDEQHDILLFDEFHERDIEAGLAWLKTPHNKKMALSATTDLLYAPNLPIYKTGLARPFEEPETYRVPLDGVNLVQEAIRQVGTAANYLIITPGIATGRAMTQALQSLGRSPTFIYGKSNKPPKGGDIVATQVVDSGADLPAIDVVVDDGCMIRNHRGRVRRLCTDSLTDKQRRGRAGRRKKGTAFTTRNAGSGFTPTPYPTWARLIREGSHGEQVRHILGITIHLPKQANPSRIDPYMRWRIGPATRLQEASLSAFWLLLCSGLSRTQAASQYDTICRQGWHEDLAGVRLAIEDTFGSSSIMPRVEIDGNLRSNPYIVTNAQGIEQSAFGIKYLDGEAVIVF